VKNFVVWVDDEPNFVDGEMFDLERRGYKTVPLYSATAALDWFNSNPQDACDAGAIVIDVLMPSLGDARFMSDIGEPVGLLLCKRLRSSFEQWDRIAPWVTLYTRSPNTPNLHAVMEFVTSNRIGLTRKNAASRIAVELLRLNRIRTR
jgi:hypothetical protein